MPIICQMCKLLNMYKWGIYANYELAAIKGVVRNTVYRCWMTLPDDNDNDATAKLPRLSWPLRQTRNARRPYDLLLCMYAALLSLLHTAPFVTHLKLLSNAAVLTY